MHKLLPDVFAPISTVILVSRLPAASASLNTEPILKRVVPINHTHTYTWGNRAQVEKDLSYPLTSTRQSNILKYSERTELEHNMKLTTSYQGPLVFTVRDKQSRQAGRDGPLFQSRKT